MIKFKFYKYDLWVGIWYDADFNLIYFCPIPCCCFIIGKKKEYYAKKAQEFVEVRL